MARPPEPPAGRRADREEEDTAGGLQGLGVLVTRPQSQADTLCRLIEERGGVAHRFPVLEILAPADPARLQRAIGELEGFDIAVFISANAVDRALGPILQQRDWPSSLRIAVIGRSSAAALARHGLKADICPVRHFNSEALLELPQMRAVNGRRIVIFRGNGGREYLADTLRRRGATVNYVEAYRRGRPQVDSEHLLQTLRDGGIDVVLVNSEESLRNLLDMAAEEARPLLRDIPLLLVSERLVPVAAGLGFRRTPLLAADATDRAVLAALLEWRNTADASPS